MAKIKINKLPEGFEIVDGKVKQKTMEHGGTVTGDQVDYGLVTTPQDFYGDTNFNDNKDQSVRYSLSRVPREDANLEAEGGETVLTDLNSNGQFGLYDIKGPRHSQGGVPMYLPEQSFIFSDTNEMKMNKEEMAEFGIESRKKKTPADISRMYPLNPFYAEINSPKKYRVLSNESKKLSISKVEYFMKQGDRYIENGELAERLILNHLIVVFNAFGIEAGLNILQLKLDDKHWPVIKPFLIFLKYITNDQFTNISMDKTVVEALRKI